MASNSRYFQIFLLKIILFANCVRGNVQLTQLDNDSLKTIYSLKQNLNIPNLISEILQLRSTGNSDCFNELSEITNGLTNLDEWAIKSEWIILKS